MDPHMIATLPEPRKARDDELDSTQGPRPTPRLHAAGQAQDANFLAPLMAPIMTTTRRWWNKYIIPSSPGLLGAQ